MQFCIDPFLHFKNCFFCSYSILLFDSPVVSLLTSCLSVNSLITAPSIFTYHLPGVIKSMSLEDVVVPTSVVPVV